MRVPIETPTRPVLQEFREKCLWGGGYVNKEDEEREEETGKAKGENVRNKKGSSAMPSLRGNKPLRFGDPQNTLKFPGYILSVCNPRSCLTPCARFPQLTNPLLHTRLLKNGLISKMCLLWSLSGRSRCSSSQSSSIIGS